MSMYNMLFGVNPLTPFLLDCIGVSMNEIPRFRDCFPSQENDGNIIIYTRTGGGNREYYEQQNEVLRQHQNFVRDWDDDFDCTYAYFEFRVLDKFEGVEKALRDLAKRKMPREAFANLLAKMNDPNHKNDPEVLRALEKIQPLIGNLIDELTSKGG